MFIRLVLISLFCFSFVFAQQPATENNLFKFCWQTEAAANASIQLSANDNKIFVPLADGSLEALEVTSGKALWRANLGGEIIGDISVNSNYIFVASQSAKNSSEQNSPMIIVRALSLLTGVTMWQKQFLSIERVSIVNRNEIVLIALRDEKTNQKVLALSAQNGQTLWQQNIASPLTSKLSIAENVVWLATKNLTLLSLKLADGSLLSQFKIPHAATQQIVLTPDSIIFGDPAGFVSAMRLTDQKILWTLRLGGAAQDILLTADKILISSYDNFIYFHKLRSGKRVWRRRLASRPLGISLLSDKLAAVTVTGESNATVIDLKNGKSIDLFGLGENNAALGAPLLNRRYLLVLTENGIHTFADRSIICQSS